MKLETVAVKRRQQQHNLDAVSTCTLRHYSLCEFYVCTSLQLMDITVTCHAMCLTIIDGSDLVILDRPGITTVCVSVNNTASLFGGCATIAYNASAVALSNDKLSACRRTRELVKYAVQTTKVTDIAGSFHFRSHMSLLPDILILVSWLAFSCKRRPVADNDVVILYSKNKRDSTTVSTSVILGSCGIV